MSAYVGHPAVTVAANGDYTVETDGKTYRVLPNNTMGWGIFTGPNLDLVLFANGPRIGFGTADDAIRALIGDPA